MTKVLSGVDSLRFAGVVFMNVDSALVLLVLVVIEKECGCARKGTRYAIEKECGCA